MYLDLTAEESRTLSALKHANPNVSLPRNPSDKTLAALGYARIHPTPRPDGDVVTPGDPELREDGKWYQTWNVREFTPEEWQAHIEQRRQELTDIATDKRWDVMTGGMTLPNGVAVGTTIDDQNRITSVVANAELAGLTDESEVDFKAASGWVRITIAEVKQIAGAIGQFVQACYTAERAHHEAIEALTTREEVAAYDVDACWPNTETAHT